MKRTPVNAVPPAKDAPRACRDDAHPARTPADAEQRGPALVRAVVLTCSLGWPYVEPTFAASGEVMDKVATGLAIFIIFALPIAFVVLFWLVHVLPEKIAEKRQHPQKDAIHVLCLLSLVFGGILWPLAWLWAYTKPVLHQLAYGRDKHEEYYEKLPGEGETDEPTVTVQEELTRLRQELDDLERRGAPPEAVRGLRGRLTHVENRSTPGNMGGGLR